METEQKIIEHFDLKVREALAVCDRYEWDGHLGIEKCQRCTRERASHPDQPRPKKKLNGQERSRLMRKICGDIGHQKFINGVLG